jgi:hypothetical protein
LRLLMEHLADPEDSVLWRCFISMLVQRDPTGTMISDASYAGVGGWSPSGDLCVKWRILRSDLVLLGFIMKQIQSMVDEPTYPSAEGLHINPLEFLAVILDLYLGIRLLLLRPPSPAGHVLLLRADNTTALSWLRFAATSKSAIARCLARVASALHLFAFQNLIKVQSNHIRGLDNHEADALSRSKNGQVPSWAAVTEQCSQLADCRVCLLPRALLLKIAGLLSSEKIEVLSGPETTELMTLDLCILEPGSMDLDCTSSLSEP